MDFSESLIALKKGHRIARKGWNGEGLVVAAQFPDDNSKMGNPYLYIDATALGGTLNPWVPSQTDLFAEDWYIIDPSSEPSPSLTFADSVRPLMKYLGENHHPHTTVIVDVTNAELLEGSIAYNSKEFVKD